MDTQIAEKGSVLTTVSRFHEDFVKRALEFL
jgi:hypothetical protein